MAGWSWLGFDWDERRFGAASAVLQVSYWTVSEEGAELEDKALKCNSSSTFQPTFYD